MEEEEEEEDTHGLGNRTPECRTPLWPSESHGLQLLSLVRSFRERGLLFDFTIKAQEHTFPCHRFVLAACSDFFRAMFEVDMQERSEGSVTLGNQSPSAVGAFLDFAYSGEAVITEANADMLFQLASFLQVSVLSRACSDFLISTLDLANCLSLWALAEGYGSSSLQQKANEFVVQNFHSLTLTQDFLEMQVEMLQVCLRADALNIASEEAVLTSLLRWLRHNLPERRGLTSGLLSLTRLHHLPAAALKALLDAEPLLRSEEACISLLTEALGRQVRYGGLLPGARPATTRSYIYTQKTEEDGEIRHSFCYSLEADCWREVSLGRGPGREGRLVPDRPGSHLHGYAEKMFVTGGCRGICCRTVRLHVAKPFHEATDEVWCLCPVTGSYAAKAPMSKPRTMHSSVSCLDRVYVIGGRTRGPRGETPSLLEVEYYDPLSDHWTSVSPLPTAIFYPESSTCGHIIYTLGTGVEMADSFNPSLDCFFSYDARHDQWTRLVSEFGQLFYARLFKAVSIHETLHLCALSIYKIYSYCPETSTWKGESSFECAGFNAGALGARDRIYILGGEYSPDEITDDVQVYHSGRRQWEEVAPMPRGLTEFHCQLVSFNRYRDPWAETGDPASYT